MELDRHLTAPTTGDYDLRIQGAGGAPSFGGSIALTVDGVRLGSVGALFGGNNRLIETPDGLTNAGATVRLEAGVPRTISITATAGATTTLQVRLAWVTPQRRQAALDAAVAAARQRAHGGGLRLQRGHRRTGPGQPRPA